MEEATVKWRVHATNNSSFKAGCDKLNSKFYKVTSNRLTLRCNILRCIKCCNYYVFKYFLTNFKLKLNMQNLTIINALSLSSYARQKIDALP